MAREFLAIHKSKTLKIVTKLIKFVPSSILSIKFMSVCLSREFSVEFKKKNHCKPYALLISNSYVFSFPLFYLRKCICYIGLGGAIIQFLQV